MPRAFLNLFLLPLIVWLFLFVPTPLVLASDFTTDYQVNYSVAESGQTNVSFAITLTNNQSRYFAPEYELMVGFPTISNLTARDSKGIIKPIIEKTSDGNKIKLVFNNKAVGLNKKQTFFVTFVTPDVVSHNGSIWEINIPGFSQIKDVDQYNVTIKTPDSFGQPIYSKPDNALGRLTFDKNQIGKAGISLAFGQKQFYHYKLTYHLQNQNIFGIEKTIALPPSTNYQDSFITSLDPKPLDVKLDNDGNWLAVYHLSPFENKTVSVEGTIKLAITPGKQTQTENQLAAYLQEQPFWQTSNSQILRLAKQLKSAKEIYDFVVKKLSYDFSRLENRQTRLGAAYILSRPNAAVCLEFTDLFIALSRAAGIPAREVDGFAYSNNSRERPILAKQDILHAWPEYYDAKKQAWIMVDPTWGNTTGGQDYFTTLDFDHVAFVIRGSSSTYPVPAGGYKDSGKTSEKDVIVTLLPGGETPSEQVELKANVAPAQIAGLAPSVFLQVTNTGQGEIANQSVLVSSDIFHPREQRVALDPLPPYGHTTVAITFEAPSLLTNSSGQITMSLEGKTVIAPVQVAFTNIFRSPILIGGIVALFTFIVLIIAAKARRLFVS